MKLRALAVLGVAIGVGAGAGLRVANTSASQEDSVHSAGHEWQVPLGPEDQHLSMFRMGHPFMVRTGSSQGHGTCIITPDRQTGNEWAEATGVNNMILVSTGQFPGGGQVYFVGPNEPGDAADARASLSMCNTAGNAGGWARITFRPE